MRHSRLVARIGRSLPKPPADYQISNTLDFLNRRLAHGRRCKNPPKEPIACGPGELLQLHPQLTQDVENLALHPGIAPVLEDGRTLTLRAG